MRFRDPETDRYRTAAQTFTTKTEAARWLSVLEADMTRGHWRDPRRGDVTFGEIAERWYATKPPPDDQAHLPDLARSPHPVDIRRRADRFDNNARSADVDLRPQCQHASGCQQHREDLQGVACVMESALAAELIARNPCRVKGAATERLPEMRCATSEQVAARAEAVEPEWRALILLAAYSRLRRGELAGLRRRYVDPLHKTVRVIEQCTQVGGHFVWGPPKTSAGTRTVVLPTSSSAS